MKTWNTQSYYTVYLSGARMINYTKYVQNIDSFVNFLLLDMV